MAQVKELENGYKLVAPDGVDIDKTHFHVHSDGTVVSEKVDGEHVSRPIYETRKELSELYEEVEGTPRMFKGGYNPAGNGFVGKKPWLVVFDEPFTT